MARKQQPEVNTNTAAVSRYRARQAKAGGSILYSSISKDATAALDAIQLRKVCSKREAVEYALLRYAAEVTRKR